METHTDNNGFTVSQECDSIKQFLNMDMDTLNECVHIVPDKEKCTIVIIDFLNYGNFTHICFNLYRFCCHTISKLPVFGFFKSLS